MSLIKNAFSKIKPAEVDHAVMMLLEERKGQGESKTDMYIDMTRKEKYAPVL